MVTKAGEKYLPGSRSPPKISTRARDIHTPFSPPEAKGFHQSTSQKKQPGDGPPERSEPPPLGGTKKGIQGRGEITLPKKRGRPPPEFRSNKRKSGYPPKCPRSSKGEKGHPRGVPPKSLSKGGPKTKFSPLFPRGFAKTRKILAHRGTGLRFPGGFSPARVTPFGAIPRVQSPLSFRNLRNYQVQGRARKRIPPRVKPPQPTKGTQKV